MKHRLLEPWLAAALLALLSLVACGGEPELTEERACELARELSAFVLGGYGEPAGPRPANACSIFDPSGTEILHYRKIHPFSMAGEDVHYLAGDRIETAEVLINYR